MQNDTASSGPPASTRVGYCTNVHAGPDLLATRANLEKHALAVKQQICPTEPMGVGLWLSAQAAADLLDQGLVEAFAAWLREVGLVPFTLNGFPYGDFHGPVVKHAVYRPTWTEAARVQYTRWLIQILDRLLPPGMEGSISTLPLEWGSSQATSREIAAAHLQQIARELQRLEQERGRLIYLCLEPEPGCALQTSQDTVSFFQECLLPGQDEELVRRYLRVCHDICHAGVMFEQQDDCLQRYASAGIGVGKIQVSSAIVLPLDQIPASDRVAAIAQLRAFAEDRYLHQTMIRQADGETPVFFEDLPQALRLVEDPQQLTGQWRVHFHVPIYLERFGALQTSRQDILDCLQSAGRIGGVKHWEVETYAWEVLPEELHRADLSDGIADELRWLRASDVSRLLHPPAVDGAIV
jgi:hypothetical protein